jgi:murein DD-endopeptidase MepM/ murein hydrolase activator NlpD
MRASWRRPIVAIATCIALALGNASTPSSPAPRSGAAAPPPAIVAGPTRGERWFAATRVALDAAASVEAPFAELGVADARSGPSAFSLEALAGQTLEITLDRAPAGAAEEGDIYVEVFRVIDVLGHPLHHRLAALRPSAASLSTRLPRDGTYHVLVQSGASGGGGYLLTLELGAALPFPVVGADAEAIRSLFGATRDAGERRHEGIDIFVQRLTPVLAVAAGRAMPAQDALGGNTVWLNTPGTSYYYAHLDRIAVRAQQRVRVGDVLGYVGNTGNARGMSSHLHFGVYRWGRQPIDPLPLLVGQRFEEKPVMRTATLAADAG